ncbi:MAG: CRISPR-associated endonuclease Cas2 [Lentisphaeria bacterium]
MNYSDDQFPHYEPIDEFTRYQIGKSQFLRKLSSEVYKNMLHLVAYDIRKPARLTKVAKICLDYGLRVEYSVFECDLSTEHFNELWQRLTDVIDHEEDTILAYKICNSCVTKITSIGPVVRAKKVLAYIF